MTTGDYEVVMALVDGNARERGRTFRSGEPVLAFSVGSEGNWIVSATGVAPLHFWLQFDGQRLYAANAGPSAMTYLQNLRIGREWQEVPDRGELRFGQARLRAQYRPVDASMSVAPRPRAPSVPPLTPSVPPRAPSVPPRAPAPSVPPHPLTPIERAAALPLPEFFGDRLRNESKASPAKSEPPSRSPELERRLPLPQRMSPLAGGSARGRGGGWKWLGLIIPAAVLPFVLGFIWVTGIGRHAGAPAALSASSEGPLAATPVSAPAALVAPAPIPVLRASALPEPPPVLEAPALALPTAAPSLEPTSSLLSPTPKAYPQNLADKPVPRIGAEPWMISEEWRAHHERLLHVPNRAQAKVVFLGDSITEGWGVSQAYRDTFGKYTPVDLGVSGDFTQNVLWRIEHGALAGTNPEVLVLMIGVNNLAGGFSPQETVSGVRAIVRAVQGQLPKARLLLLAILPARQNPTDPVRLRIVEANRLLAALAAPPNVDFHDVGSVMLEPDGTLSKTTMRDFIHPTASGYERLSAAVAPLVDALLPHGAE